MESDPESDIDFHPAVLSETLFIAVGSFRLHPDDLPFVSVKVKSVPVSLFYNFGGRSGLVE